MSTHYSKAHFDFSNLPWLTSPRHKLDLQSVALGLIRLPPDAGYTFTHRHRQQEEVYCIIEGGGEILVDEELLPLEPGDIIRVSPESRRALKAGEEGLFAICAGGITQGFPANPNSRYLIDDGVPDYDDIPPWYKDDPQVKTRNEKLKMRMLKARARRDSP